MHHYHVWGCKAEVQVYNPQIKKLDPKSISSYFVGYCIGLRGSRFFCSSHTTRIMESYKTFYFEDDEPVVGQDELVIDKHDIPAIVDASVPLRRSQRYKRSTILDGYEVYL